MTDLKFYCKREHVSNETEFNASYSGGPAGSRTRRENAPSLFLNQILIFQLIGFSFLSVYTINIRILYFSGGLICTIY